MSVTKTDPPGFEINKALFDHRKENHMKHDKLCIKGITFLLCYVFLLSPVFSANYLQPKSVIFRSADEKLEESLESEVKQDAEAEDKAKDEKKDK